MSDIVGRTDHRAINQEKAGETGYESPDVVIFRGSPRRSGNTNALTDIFADTLHVKGFRITEFDLYRMDIRPCLACRVCQRDWNHINCVQTDDMGQIFPAVMDCRLMVFATPIYSWYCTPPVKSLLDRLVYAMNMYYGNSRGPSLWEGKHVALITTCGYRPEKGADLFEEGIRRYCKHSKLKYDGMLCKRHMGYGTVFMDEEKKRTARNFAEKCSDRLCAMM